jgi:hypothetical protein
MNQTSHFSNAGGASELLAKLFAYWEKIRGGNDVPARADFDPFANPRLLSHVYLLETQHEGQYRIRTAGEDVTRFSGRNIAGRFVDADLYGPIASRLLEALDFVCLSRRPVLVKGCIIVRRDSYWSGFETILLPLANSLGEITQILGGWVTVEECVALPQPAEVPALARMDMIADPFRPASTHVEIGRVSHAAR